MRGWRRRRLRRVRFGRDQVFVAHAPPPCCGRGTRVLGGVPLLRLCVCFLMTSRRIFSLRRVSRKCAQAVAQGAHAGPATSAHAPRRNAANENWVARITETNSDGRHHDVGAGAVEAGGEPVGQELADGAARAHGLALEGDGAEGEGQERGERQQQQEEAGRLGVGRLDGPAPEQLPARDAEHQRQQQRGQAEELRDQQLGQEGADGSDEVARGPARARP